MRELSIYIHIPFCVKKCDYCDFLSAPATKSVQEQYLHALFHEIRERSRSYKEYLVNTIFIGGGTPSVLEPKDIGKLMKVLGDSFNISPDAEISMEVNPGTVSDKESFFIYREAGINRLSIGLQSANDEELKTLGRIHTFSQFETTWEMARAAGFTNLNVDIMSALPGQSVESYRKTLETVCALKPEHISAYSLIIEEGTPFFDRYSYLLEDAANEERDRQMYLLTEQILKENGYERYEISNYAKTGRECIHNIVYWTRGEYLGLGIGASSMINNARYKNADNLRMYIDSAGLRPYEEVQNLSVREQMEEFLFLGLRLTKGVLTADFERIFGCSVKSVFGNVLEKNRRDGLLLMDENRIVLTPKGLDLSNYVFAQFLE